MTLDEVLSIIKALRKQRAELHNYWATTKRKIRPSERAMALAAYQRELEALDRVINLLLIEQANDTTQQQEK